MAYNLKVLTVLLTLVICIPAYSLLADGEFCNNAGSCQSGNCDWVPHQYASICCKAGEDCCLVDYDCKDKGVAWNCTDEFYCVKDQKELWESCSVDNQCKSNNCTHGYCCESGYECCKESSECRVGEICEQGTGHCIDKPDNLVPKRTLCEICSVDSDCDSGKCMYYDDGSYKCSLANVSNTCCSDGYHITNKQQGVDCCGNSDCDSGKKCTNHKCVAQEPPPDPPEPPPSQNECSESSDCPSGCCLWSYLDYKPTRVAKCISKGSTGKQILKDSGGYYPRNYICCGGELAMGGYDEELNCCSASDCVASEECVANKCTNNYADFFDEMKSKPRYLLGADVPGLSEEELEDYYYDSLKRTVFGLGNYLGPASSWADVARAESEKGKMRLNNSWVIGFFRIFKKSLNIVGVVAQVADVVNQAPEQLDNLRKIGNYTGVLNKIDVVCSFADNMSTIYGAVQQTDEATASKIGLPKVNGNVMKLVSIAGSHGWSLVSEAANGVFDEEWAAKSSSYETDVSMLCFMMSYHAARIYELLEIDTPSREDTLELVEHARIYVILKKVEKYMDYKDSVITWQEKPSAMVRAARFLGFMNTEEIVDEKKSDYDEQAEALDEILEYISEVEQEWGLANEN